MFYSVHVSFNYQVCLKYTAKIITKLFKFISDVSTNPGKSEISHFDFYVFLWIQIQTLIITADTTNLMTDQH